MTVTSTQRSQEYTGNGTQTDFIFTIQGYSEEWFSATVDDVDTPVTFVMNPDQENNPGGTATIAPAPVDQSVVVIARVVPLDQLVEFPDYGAFPARNNEDALDKVTMTLTQFVGVETIDDLQDQITVNADDIAGLEANKADTSYVDSQDADLQDDIDTRILRAGDSMVGNLDVNYPPAIDSSAAPAVWVLEQIALAIGGLEFLGFYDASTNINPPDGTASGQLWVIAVGGDLQLSNGVDAPVTETVQPTDRIIWDNDNDWWVFLQPDAISAALVSFANAGTNYVATNVQAALVEADATLFVNRIDEQEGIAGNKNWIGEQSNGNVIGSYWRGIGDAGPSENQRGGTFRIVTLADDTTVFSKRSTDGLTWIEVATIPPSGEMTFNSILPRSSQNPTEQFHFARKAYVDFLGNGNHRATEALALQASIDNPNQLFYANEGS